MDNCKCCLMRLSRIGLACQFGAYESIHTYSLLCCGNGKVAMYQGWYPHPELPTIPFICNWRRDDFAVALHILNRLGHDLQMVFTVPNACRGARLSHRRNSANLK
ncbi:hypothetical protein EV681_2864 [Advenella incenata]|uniref:Uncharacterized protein n=1 Tax=Advenella incenata TaxID=267800 RepID=A0A4Q7VCJ7_9BURK|nr:hypothetical protein EV681_2864 [Advenella incenata]